MNDIMKNFEARTADKKAAQPKLHRFDREFTIGILAEHEEEAEEKAEFVKGILKQFSDVVSVERNN